MKTKKQEKRDQNELKRLQNISRNQNGVGKNKANSKGVENDIQQNRVNLRKKMTEKQVKQIHVSTASAGRFQQNIVILLRIF